MEENNFVLSENFSVTLKMFKEEKEKGKSAFTGLWCCCQHLREREECFFFVFSLMDG